MFINKLNRKFKRVLALSSLGAICCSQNVIVNANDLHSIARADRKAIYEKIHFYDKKENQTIKLLDGTNLNFSYSYITEKIYKEMNEFIALNYKYGNMTEFKEAIVVKDKLGRIFALPYSSTIIELLPYYYDKLDEAYSPVKNEDKWWDKTDECIKHLKSLKEKYGDISSDDTYLDDIKRYLGLKSRGQTIVLLGVTGTAILVGGVLVVKSLLSSVGEVVHGKK